MKRFSSNTGESILSQVLDVGAAQRNKLYDNLFLKLLHVNIKNKKKLKSISQKKNTQKKLIKEKLKKILFIFFFSRRHLNVV